MYFNSPWFKPWVKVQIKYKCISLAHGFNRGYKAQIKYKCISIAHGFNRGFRARIKYKCISIAHGFNRGYNARIFSRLAQIFIKQPFPQILLIETDLRRFLLLNGKEYVPDLHFPKTGISFVVPFSSD